MRSLLVMMTIVAAVVAGSPVPAGAAPEPDLAPAPALARQPNAPRPYTADEPDPPQASSLSCDEMRANWERLAERARQAGGKGVVCSRPGSIEKARGYLQRRPADQDNTVAMEPIPEWCFDHAFDGYWLTRTQACQIWAKHLVVTDPNTGVVLAEMDLVLIDYSYTFADSTTWGQQKEIQVIDGWGAIEGTTVEGTVADCVTSQSTPSCDVVSVNFPVQSGEVGSVVRGEAFFESPGIPSGEIRQERAWLWGTFKNPDWHSTHSFLDVTPFERCDNAVPGYSLAGCVYADYVWPTIIYGVVGPYSELAVHIAMAQASGLPGAYPDGTMPNSAPLHRLTSDVLNTLNRDAACVAPGYPRPPGKSCDEYPMASTEEGAFTGGGEARTFDWCEIDEPPGEGPIGYSVCMIDDWQNSAGGSLLNQILYVPLRILDGDPFYIWIDQSV